MSVAILGGFVYVDAKQRELARITDVAREMRRGRQALMEVDSSVTTAMAQIGGENVSKRHYEALARLATHPADHFPGTTLRDGQAVPTATLLEELKTSWEAAWTTTAAGDNEAARRGYRERKTASVLADIVATMYTALDKIEVRYTALNDRIAFVTSLLLALQVMTGLACALVFRRESKARGEAVASANQTREHVERLFGMADMLQSASDHADANAVLRSTASELLTGFSGALYVFNNSRDRLVLSTSWDHAGEALPETLGLNDCWALKRGKPHVNRPDSKKLCCEHHRLASFGLEIPMVARGEILGLLQVFTAGDGAEARLGHVEGMATAIADAMSLALSNIALREKLRGQALRDPLTGLYNRRYMEDTLERFVRLADRESREFSVMMIDLDHFKRLNDQHGHAKGDAVLRDAAAAIVNQIRESDVACRYGGEELIVLLPDCGLDMAAQKAESIRASIEFLSQPNGAQVSASIGVAAIPSTSGNAKELLANADAALYLAKQAGRNQVMMASKRGGPAFKLPPTNENDGPSALTPAAAAE